MGLSFSPKRGLVGTRDREPVERADPAASASGQPQRAGRHHVNPAEPDGLGTAPDPLETEGLVDGGVGVGHDDNEFFRHFFAVLLT